MRLILLLPLALLATRLASAQETATAGAVLFRNVCAQCHGGKGEGNHQLQAPAIAGLPAWYVTQQLENFRAGRRGSHPQDLAGQMMRSISLALDEAKSADTAALVATLPLSRPVATLKADSTAGARLYAERCAECHRFNGAGELAFGAAPLAGLPDWYLLAQLEKFKNGQRGAAPKDVNGQKMVLAASYIEDDAMLKSLAAYLVTLGAGKGNGQ